MIYTSYFDKRFYGKPMNWGTIHTVPFVESHYEHAYSIANSAPKVKGEKYSLFTKISCVVPDWNTIVKPYKDKEIDEKEYKNRYINQLCNNVVEIKRVCELILAPKLAPTFLLCWEKPNKFCHRHILRDWLNSVGFLKHEIREFV